MASSNSEGICHQDDIMAKEYDDLAEENDDVNGRTQLIKLVEYHSEKQNSFYPAVFVITAYLALACH